MGGWDEATAEATARRLGIEGGLTAEHWAVLRYVREAFIQDGRTPLVYDVCRACKLDLASLRRLFPTGYLRGVCAVAGISAREAWALSQMRAVIFGGAAADGDLGAAAWVEGRQPEPEGPGEAGRPAGRGYVVDAAGYLVDPTTWDEAFARGKAGELAPRVPLGADHLRVIGLLRAAYAARGSVPTVIEACDAAGLELEDLERLFPTGYNRGAVKIAGLRPRR